MSSTNLPQHAERIQAAFSEIIRHFQFRDRDQICCHGISVTQCYALHELDAVGNLPMGELAEHLRLEVSSATRAADGLVRQKLIERAEDPDDRRIRRVRITRKGRSLLKTIRAESVEAHKQILAQVPDESREAVVGAMERLLEAYSKCCKPECCNDE